MAEPTLSQQGRDFPCPACRHPARVLRTSFNSHGVLEVPGWSVLPTCGAVPVHKAGELVGAIGASSAPAEQDEQCAQAGAAAL